jgi:hypothetical protein
MESEKHSQLVVELTQMFKNKGYAIKAVDGVTDEKPEVVENKGIGDGENKIPDIEAHDNNSSRVIRGEAKVGNGDIESEHSITQYKIFSNRNKNGVDSWLYIIVPKADKQYLNSIVTQNVSKEWWKNISLVESDSY